MIGGADEPLYLPGRTGRRAQLFYREDFVASALHEAAHWCIAGEQRRRQVDFGYAYEPPPRTVFAQSRFFATELKTQALEWWFAEAAGIDFKASADNLAPSVGKDLGKDVGMDAFTDKLVRAQPAVEDWLSRTSGARAQLFSQALQALRCEIHGPS